MRPLFPAVAVFAVSHRQPVRRQHFVEDGHGSFRRLDRFGHSRSASAGEIAATARRHILMMVQFIGTLTLFKWGWDVSVVIPIMGLCYVGTAILGKWMLGEPVNAMRWLGIFLIILGVVFIARSVTQAKIP